MKAGDVRIHAGKARTRVNAAGNLVRDAGRLVPGLRSSAGERSNTVPAVGDLVRHADMDADEADIEADDVRIQAHDGNMNADEIRKVANRVDDLENLLCKVADDLGKTGHLAEPARNEGFLQENTKKRVFFILSATDSIPKMPASN